MLGDEELGFWCKEWLPSFGQIVGLDGQGVPVCVLKVRRKRQCRHCFRFEFLVEQKQISWLTPVHACTGGKIALYRVKKCSSDDGEMVMARIGSLFAGTTETSPFKIDCIESSQAMLYSKLLCVLPHDQYQQSMVKTLRSTGWKMLGKINCGRVYTVSYILCACCTSLLVLFLAFLLAKSSTASALVQLMFACVLFCTATISSTRVISASISHKQIVPTGKKW